MTDSDSTVDFNNIHEQETEPMVKEECLEGDPYIVLKVIGQDDVELQFRVKKDGPLGKLKKVYCTKRMVTMATQRFLYDGARIADEMTPKELKMRNGDTIEVYMERVGGAFGTEQEPNK